jgi:hypothetical protein
MYSQQKEDDTDWGPKSYNFWTKLGNPAIFSKGIRSRFHMCAYCGLPKGTNLGKHIKNTHKLSIGDPKLKVLKYMDEPVEPETGW